VAGSGGVTLPDSKLPRPSEKPRRLIELGRRERRRAMLHTALFCLISVAAIVAIYFVLPIGKQDSTTEVIVRLAIGVVLFGATLVWEVRRITRSVLPDLRAFEALAIALPLFLTIYAGAYVRLSTVNAGNFTQHLGRSDGLYFAITTFGTVGYGDIAPRHAFARMLVSSQIIADLAFLAVLLRVFVLASRLTLKRGEVDFPEDGQPD
jgi:voltage-gated potassium channel